MPDGDVFSHSVPRGWTKVSRRVFAGGEDVTVVRAAVKALVRELQQLAPETLGKLVDAIRWAEGLPVDKRWYAFGSEVQEIQLEDDCEFLRVLVQGAERTLLKLPDERPSSQIERQVTLGEVLAEAIDGRICGSPALAQGVVQLGINSEMMQDRLESFGAALRESEALLEAAVWLEQVNASRRPAIRATQRSRISQAEIVSLALC